MDENSSNKESGESDESSHHEGMSNRGTTRPMSEHEDDGNGHHEMSADERRHMLHMHHKQTLWIYWTLIMLGIWMVLSPLTFSYAVGTVEPSGGREVWLSMEARISAMKWSDIISGILLIIFGWRSLRPNRPVSLWACCFVGIWISMAPLLFWAPTAEAYLNNTFVGMWVIALTVLIPGMPNMIMYMKMGSETPPGWSYNPSSWPQRWIMIATGFFGWCVSRYLGAYQLGYIDYAWDPFFGNSTVTVLDSDLSHSWPISDAALGTLAYTFEFLMGFMGSPSRWRTMPWMVTIFGILVIPLGLVHIALVISQPVIVGAWCTFCLLAAAIMLPMIPLEVDEVIAMGQHMVQRKRRGDSMWRVFWKGGEPVEQNTDDRSPPLIDFPENPGKVFMASIWGMSFPWTLTLSTVIGIWLMFAPATFGVSIETTAADINHLGGALIIVIAVISMAEVLRAGRFLNVLVGLIVAVLPWFLQDIHTGLLISSTVCGITVIMLSVPFGPKKEEYGLWESYIK